MMFMLKPAQIVRQLNLRYRRKDMSLKNQKEEDYKRTTPHVPDDELKPLEPTPFLPTLVLSLLAGGLVLLVSLVLKSCSGG